MPQNYRTPTSREFSKLSAARKLMQQGIEGENSMLSRMMPTIAKSSRDEIRRAKELREKVPAAAREGEAYNEAGYAKGGSVKGSGCEQRGLRKCKVV